MIKFKTFHFTAIQGWRVMNIAVIFAGGVGSRMGNNIIPKQFLKVHSKPIIIYTLERFAIHDEIDAIVVACKTEYIDKLNALIKKWDIKKIATVVPGGETGQKSIFNALKKAEELYPSDSIVLVHDGVRPFVNSKLISECIQTTKQRGSAITVCPAIETISTIVDGNKVDKILDRSSCYVAKAPQAFFLTDLLQAHRWAISLGLTNLTDSATLMKAYGKPLYTVIGDRSNIKITTPTDFYFMRALLSMEEDKQLINM